MVRKDSRGKDVRVDGEVASGSNDLLELCRADGQGEIKWCYERGTYNCTIRLPITVAGVSTCPRTREHLRTVMRCRDIVQGDKVRQPSRGRGRSIIE